MHQGCLLKILWITSSAKTHNINPIKKESLRLRATSKRQGKYKSKLKIQT